MGISTALEEDGGGLSSQAAHGLLRYVSTAPFVKNCSSQWIW
jgi:hypothetical protein